MATPHDSLFHTTFRHAVHAGSWARSILPQDLAAAIDWSTLAPAPERMHGSLLRMSIGDLVFTARATDGRPLLVLLEHRSRDDGLEDQVLRYVTHLGNHPGSGTIPVVPIVCHHGPTPFAPRRRRHVLERLRPRSRFHLDDLAAIPEAALRSRSLTPHAALTLACLASLPGASPAATLAMLDRWADHFVAIDRDLSLPGREDVLTAIGWYVLHVTEADPEEVHMTIERILQRPEETIVSTAERLRREGRAEGRIETLLRLAQRRFGDLPPAAEQRLRAGTPAELLGWTDRILDAASLDDLFASGAPDAPDA